MNKIKFPNLSLFKKENLPKKEEPLLFKIQNNIENIPQLPDFTDKSKINVKYPLIEPYTFVHIYYDSNLNEVIYELEEPKLDDKEKEILKLVEEGIRELINISFINIKDEATVIEYLEKNLRILLKELNVILTKDPFLKIMYYIYRNFIGLNQIEPLMRDYYIEDIECNGVNSHLYIVHRKYRHLRTSVIFTSLQELTSFVEKLAQKCGKYISYASPLLDGSLPSGERINATYTQEISSKGPAFTIRKFTKEPWTPIRLMDFRTVSPEILAYLWLLVEYESNIMVIGGTGSGKCITGDTPIYLSNGKKVKIKELVETKLKKNKSINSDGWELSESDGTEVLSLNTNTLKIEKRSISKFWRHKAPEKLYKIKTRSGRKIVVTPEHPFFTLNSDGLLEKIRADKINKSYRIATPRNVPVYKSVQNIKLINYIKDSPKAYIPNIQKQINKIILKLIKKFKLKSVTLLALKYNVKPKTFLCWKEENSMPLKVYYRLATDAGISINDKLKLKAKTNSRSRLTHIPKISPKLFRFIGLVLADGHLRKNGVELHNSNKDLLNEFIRYGKELFGITSKIEDYGYRTPKVRICSPIISDLLNKAFEVPIGKKARIIKVPQLLFENNEECIKEFLSAIIDCEGYFNKVGLEIGMTSDVFLDELAYLFNRLNIVARRVKGQIDISGFENIKFIKGNIILRDKEKCLSINKIINRKIKTTISNVDLIPNMSNLIKLTRTSLNLTQNQLSKEIGISRRLVGRWEDGSRNPSFNTFNKLSSFIEESNIEVSPKILNIAKSDIFWDEIKEIEVLEKHNEKYVYDLTVEENHNFLAGNIPIITHNTSFLNAVAFFIPPSARIVSIEDTRELMLMHENWLPSVAREGYGPQRHGEVSLFDLLKESFRQRPDYVIVGEVRGAEASVLMQGASSGHPSMGTMHAEDVETMIRRLETPPINLSPSLIESLDAVCIMIQTKVQGKDVRRLKEVAEIIKVGAGGKAELNTPFIRDPRSDKFYFKRNSHIFNKIITQHGITQQELEQEFNRRIKVLMAMYQQKIFNVKEAHEIIASYYKIPQKVLQRFNIA